MTIPAGIGLGWQRTLTVHHAGEEAFPIGRQLSRLRRQYIESGRLAQPPGVGRFLAEKAFEQVDLAVDDVAQRRHNRAVGARHGGVQGLLIKPLAERQKLCGRPGIVSDGIV